MVRKYNTKLNENEYAIFRNKALKSSSETARYL